MSRHVLVAALLLVAGCGSVPAPRAKTIEIEVTNLAFATASVDVHVGDTVVWVNTDTFPHTATAQHGDWKVTLPPGERGSVVIQKAGTVEYYCELHPNMTSRLVATER